MRELNDILASKKIQIMAIGKDGFRGFITIRGWKGSVIASKGAGWEHVSVSPIKSNYTPVWDDMCVLKELFFYDNEAVIQIHPPKDEYVNNMPNCLHLWRCYDKEMNLPPSFMVGLRKGQTEADVMREAKEYYKKNGYEW